MWCLRVNNRCEVPGVWFLNCSLTFVFSCFTTEILDGFDIQRTSGFADTQRRYCHLTRSIIEYYVANFSSLAETCRVCPTYGEFKRKCRELEKTTVSQIFALQLMQVARQYLPLHESYSAGSFNAIVECKII